MTLKLDQLMSTLSIKNFWSVGVLSALLFFASCNPDEILENGGELSDDTNVNTCFEDNFQLGTTIKFFKDSLYTGSLSSAIVGDIDQGDIGTTESSVYMRPNISSTTTFDDGEEFIGFELYLVFNGYSYGDTLSAIEFEGRALKNELEILRETVDQIGDTIVVSVPRYHFDIIPEDSIGNNLFEPLAEQVFFKDLDEETITTVEGNTSTLKTLRIPLDTDLGEQLFTLDSLTDSTVVELFKGIALDVVTPNVYYGIDGTNSKFRLLYNDRDEDGNIIMEDDKGILTPKEFTYDMSVGGFFNILYRTGSALGTDFTLGDTLNSVNFSDRGYTVSGTPIYSIVDFEGALELLNRTVEEDEKLGDNPLTNIVIQRAELSIGATTLNEGGNNLQDNQDPPSQLVFSALSDEIANDGQIVRNSDGSLATLFTETGDAALSATFSSARSQYSTMDITSYFNARLRVLRANSSDDIADIEKGDLQYVGPMVILPASTTSTVNKLAFPNSESDVKAPATGIDPNVPLNLNLKLYYTVFGSGLTCSDLE